MKFVPIHLKQANEFVKKYHRHNKPVVGHKFTVALEENGEIIGVGIAGRPVSRHLDNGRNVEITRVCVKEGYQNACSKVYARMKRIAQLMGFEKIITYTLETESGSSLRAINADPEFRSPGHDGWKRTDVTCNYQAVYKEPKIRWELNVEKSNF